MGPVAARCGRTGPGASHAQSAPAPATHLAASAAAPPASPAGRPGAPRPLPCAWPVPAPAHCRASAPHGRAPPGLLRAHAARWSRTPACSRGPGAYPRTHGATPRRASRCFVDRRGPETYQGGTLRLWGNQRTRLAGPGEAPLAPPQVAHGDFILSATPVERGRARGARSEGLAPAMITAAPRRHGAPPRDTSARDPASAPPARGTRRGGGPQCRLRALLRGVTWPSGQRRRATTAWLAASAAATAPSAPCSVPWAG